MSEPRKNRLLLVGGALSSLLYAAMNVLIALQWEGYSSAAQAVSELSAVGAPTRALWVSLGFVYTLLVCAFGYGVWACAGESRRLRIAGGLILAYGVVGLAWPLAPMHLRGAQFGPSDAWHIVLSVVTVALMLLAMGFAAGAFGERFRLYSLATIAILVVFGALTGLDAPNVAANLPTPWLGVWERIAIGAFLLWVVVLALLLLNRKIPTLKISRRR